MTSRALAFVIWAAVAACIVYWALKLSSVSRPVPLHAVVVGEAATGGDLARLFGRGLPAPAPGPAPVAATTQLKLIGVVAPRAGSSDMRAGVALISVEGKPPRTYRIGSPVDSELVLLSVHQRGATLGPRDGKPTLRLELPPLPAPATGTLPVAGAMGVAPPPRPGRLPPVTGLPPPAPQEVPETQPSGDQAELQSQEENAEPAEPGERPGEPGDRPVN